MYILCNRTQVRHRPEGQSRSNMPTGEIEVLAEELSVLNAASDLPFVPREYQKKHEALRLQYRYVSFSIRKWIKWYYKYVYVYLEIETSQF